MPGALHNSIVADLAATVEGFRSSGFREAIRRAIVEMNPFPDDEDCSRREFYDHLIDESGVADLGLYPDGYTISVIRDAGGSMSCALDIFEVEVAHQFSARKLSLLGDFADNCGGGKFFVTLYLIGRNGVEWARLNDEDLMRAAYMDRPQLIYKQVATMEAAE